MDGRASFALKGRINKAMNVVVSSACIEILQHFFDVFRSLFQKEEVLVVLINDNVKITFIVV